MGFQNKKIKAWNVETFGIVQYGKILVRIVSSHSIIISDQKLIDWSHWRALGKIRALQEQKSPIQ